MASLISMFEMRLVFYKTNLYSENKGIIAAIICLYLTVIIRNMKLQNICKKRDIIIKSKNFCINYCFNQI